MSEVKIGSVWRENDKRFERYVKIMAIVLQEDKAEITPCNKYGVLAATYRTKAKLSRFGKAYKRVDLRP